MRPDGTQVKDLPPLVAAIPYIMPQRYDAQNTATDNLDEAALQAFIRSQRRQSVRLNHMSVIISAYYKAVHHQSGLYQDQLYPPPLLRVWHHQRVRMYRQARAQLHGRESEPEDDASGHCHG